MDWTYPAIGTVCIDLATLLHVAPATHRDRLIARYRAQRPVQDFDSIYTAARVHVNLAILEWMSDAIRTGQGHTVERAKLQEAVEQLFDYFSVENPVTW